MVPCDQWAKSEDYCAWVWLLLDEYWICIGTACHVWKHEALHPPSKLQQGQGIHTKLNLAAHAPTDLGLIQWESRCLWKVHLTHWISCYQAPKPVWVYKQDRVGFESYHNPNDIDGVGSETTYLSHLVWLLAQEDFIGCQFLPYTAHSFSKKKLSASCKKFRSTSNPHIIRYLHKEVDEMTLENKLKASKCSWVEGRLKRTQTDIHGASPSLPSHECHGHRRINKNI